VKVFISADIEGITGLVSWSQCGRPSSDYYDYAWARERFAADVNAAIRGARAAGATEVVVKDSHGNSKNLLVSDLEEGTQLISGHGSGFGGMMTGIDRDCTAALLVGYHAMAGTPSAIMEHTLTGYVHRMWVNDIETGEIGLSAGVAGCFEVPVVMISSDQAGCAEGQRVNPMMQTAVVKDGFGRFMGTCLHPSDTEKLIFEAARKGVELASSMDPYVFELPVRVKIEFNRSEEATAAARLIGVRRLDGYTVEYEADSYATAHQAAWSMISVADLGHSADK